MNEYIRLNGYPNGEPVYLNPQHLAFVSHNNKSSSLCTIGGAFVEVMETAQEIFDKIDKVKQEQDKRKLVTITPFENKQNLGKKLSFSTEDKTHIACVEATNTENNNGRRVLDLVCKYPVTPEEWERLKKSKDAGKIQLAQRVFNSIKHEDSLKHLLEPGSDEIGPSEDLAVIRFTFLLGVPNLDLKTVEPVSATEKQNLEALHNNMYDGNSL